MSLMGLVADQETSARNSTLGTLPPSVAGRFFSDSSDAGSDTTGKPYVVIPGQLLGLDNNYQYAVYRDGRVEHAYQGNDPTYDPNTSSTPDPGVRYRSMSELIAEGGKTGGADSHGVPLIQGDVGGYRYAPQPDMKNGPGGLADGLGLGAFTLMTMGLGSAAAAGAGAGMAGGAAGSMSAADAATLGAMTEGAGVGSSVAGGTAAAGGAAAGGGMDVLDMFGSQAGAPAFSTDAGLWGSSAAGAADPTVLDMFGSTADTPGWSSNPAAWDPASMSIPGAGGGGVWDSILHGLGALGGGVSNFFGTPLGGGGASVGSITPGLLALAYAARQPGVDTSSLRGVIDELSGNQNAVVRAATDPVQANIASGYGDLVQRLGSRGVLGSSFGNTDISNYLTAGDRSLGDVGATAAQKALGLRGDLSTNLATLSAKAQEIKNNLYGRAFDVLGRGLNPSGYAGNINVGGMPGGGGAGGGGNPLGFLGGLLNAGSGLFGKIGDLFKGGGGSPLADTGGAGDLMDFGSNFA